LELTPEQIAENNRIKDLPAITNLRDGQEDIKHSVEILSETIDREQKQNKEEFARGAEKFNKLETKIAELEDTMNVGLTAINSSIVGLKAELKDDKITKLQNQIDKRDTNDEDSKKTKVLFIQAVTVVILSVCLTAIFANVPSVSIVG